MRLDQYLVQKAGLSRQRVQQMIKEGHVTLNGKIVTKPAATLSGDEDIQFQLPEESQEASVLAENVPLHILYEDESLAVIDKPAGMVVHPGAGGERQTMVSALLHRYGFLPPTDDATKPGIVHRLDKGTSGCIVVARTEAVLQNLQQQFKERTVEKIYLAFVGGRPPLEGHIDSPLGRHPKNRQKISSKSKKGREALTRWKVIEQFGKWNLLEVTLHTGRTHQIRAHLSEAGYPLIGDAMYGRQGNVFNDCILRPALHATRLSFTHPVSNQWLTFEAPMPEDMRRLLDHLRIKHNADAL